MRLCTVSPMNDRVTSPINDRATVAHPSSISASISSTTPRQRFREPAQGQSLLRDEDFFFWKDLARADNEIDGRSEAVGYCCAGGGVSVLRFAVSDGAGWRV